MDYILNTDVSKEELKENLLTMERNTDRLLTLINQLLDFRKTESKVLRLNFEQTDIGELVHNIYIRFKSAAQQKGLNITIELPHELLIASVDKEVITKVYSNLFTNGIKYSKSYMHIFINHNPEHKYFEVRVNNDGEPIPIEFRDKIFEAFFQLNDKNSQNQSGSGIGLALASSLIQLHKGQIFIDNNQTECTSFVVHVPTNMDKSGINARGSTQKEVFNKHPINESVHNSQTTILIVEDNEELLTFVSEKLGKSYEIVKANNGAEALEIMEKHKVSIIVSDIIMPIMDGVELCKTIKSDIQTCHIPVILLTAKTNLNSKIEGLKAGADAYLEKPFSLSHLLVQISNLLENHEKLRKNFAGNPFIATNTMAHTKADEIFLNKLTDVVRQNIEEEISVWMNWPVL
ncbi:MAG: hybrid sensor histidine kinase/response regulator [Bacteroides sp.]|nr:hybrid sensor histidine kinase/response regulator [Bacteroides sp.]